MTQKIITKKRNTWKQFFTLSLFLLSFQVLSVSAQNLSSVDANSMEAITISGTPIEEIISAVSEGGLSTTQDLAALKPDIKEQAPEILASSFESPSEPNPEPAAFNPDSLKYLESQGGLSSSPQVDTENPTIFKMAVKFFERVIFKKDVEFANRPKFDEGMDISGTPTFDKDTAGFAIIKKGNQSVVVDFNKEYDSSPVVTATLSLQNYKDPEVKAVAEDLLLISDVKYIVTGVSKKSFQIMMDREADSDIPFAWHALAVDKPKTFKKKGDSPKDDTASESEPRDSGANSPTGDQDDIFSNLTSNNPGIGGDVISNQD